MKFPDKDIFCSVTTKGIVLIMITGILLICCSCHTEKKLAKTTSAALPEKSVASKNEINDLSPGFILQKLKENTIPFQTLSANAKLDISTPNGTQNGISTYIRMQKDSAIWISVRPLLGIELVRILITPDSVKVINFFKRTVTLRSADSLQQLFHIPFDFSSLQNLIIGNPPVLSDSIHQIAPDSTDNGIAFSCQNPDWICNYMINAGNYLLLKNTLLQKDTSMGARSSEESFEDYIMIDQHPFATKRHLIIQTGSETTVDIKFSHVDFNKVINFPFPEVNNFRRE